MTASANRAIGKAQIGRVNDCRKALRSMNGAVATIEAAPKIPTSVVDHGSETAIRMKKISAAVAQAAGFCHRLAGNVASDSLATVLTPCSLARDRQAMSY